MSLIDCLKDPDVVETSYPDYYCTVISEDQKIIDNWLIKQYLTDMNILHI